MAQSLPSTSTLSFTISFFASNMGLKKVLDCVFVCKETRLDMQFYHIFSKNCNTGASIHYNL